MKHNNNSKSKIHIKWKIFAYLALFTSLILIILWLFQIVFLDDFYQWIKTKELESNAQKLAQNINSGSLSSLVSEISSENETCILILGNNSQNRILSEDAKKYNCILHSITDVSLNMLYNSAKENPSGSVYYYYRDIRSNQFFLKNNEKTQNLSNTDGLVYTIYMRYVTTSSGEDRVILLNSIISPVTATVNTLTVQLSVITMILLVFSLLLAVFISRKISKPIIDINRSAKQLAQGNYEEKFCGKGFREVSELADTLNYASQELSKVDKLKTELIANLSHDLRTPLTLISGYAEVMRDIPGENTPENVQIIIDETQRLSSLVTELLNLSKMQSGVLELNKQPFSLTDMIIDILSRYNKLIENDGYHIHFTFDQPTTICADKSLISQIIYNLVSNAITHTGKDKCVNVRQYMTETPSKEKVVRMEVIDSGEGIDKKDLPYIWDRYYKVDKHHKRQAMGSGLGLSIVKSVVELHQGTCGVTSELQKGSIFYIELPIQ